MADSLTRRHAIISGGSSGIGLAVARYLFAEGWDLSLIARDEERLSSARRSLFTARRFDTQAVNLIIADVSESTKAIGAVEQAVANLGVPEMLVTSAGIAVPGYFEDLPLETHRRAMDVNYFGTLHLVGALVPAMKKKNRGHIVMISSGAGLVGIFGYSAYSPSKFAVRGLGESLRGELKPFGIRVSIAFPPDTDTPQLRIEDKTKPAETRAIAGNAAARTPDAVAYAILTGVFHHRFIIAPGWEMGLLARWHSLIAPVLRVYFDWQANRAKPQ